MIHCEESHWAGARDREGALKSLITSETATVERKGRDISTQPCFVRLLMTTNDAWAVPVSADERRFCVLDVSDSRRGDRAYFRDLYAEIEGGGPAAFLHHLLGVDLADFEVRDVPQTAGLLQQKIEGLDGLERWWFEALHGGEAPGADALELFDDGLTAWADGAVSVARSAVRASYGAWCRANPRRARELTPESFGRGLKRLAEVSDGRAPGKGRARAYVLPPLADCRAQFERHLGAGEGEIDWG